MADNSDDQSKDDPKVDDRDKQTNRTFTQSEVDSLISKQVAKVVADKYSDYETNQQELQSLAKEKKERDEAEMTELQKAKTVIDDLTDNLTTVNIQNTEFKKTVLKQRVLNDPKYANLPRAYKNSVAASDDEAAVIESAEEMLKEFKQDTGDTVLQNFGLKDPTPKSTAPLMKDPGDYAKALKQQIADKLKSR